jgi:hypothetical protein
MNGDSNLRRSHYMAVLLEENLDFNKLAKVLFSKKEAFRVHEIMNEIGCVTDESILKNILYSLVDNGVLIQQGSTYSLRKF